MVIYFWIPFTILLVYYVSSWEVGCGSLKSPDYRKELSSPFPSPAYTLKMCFSLSRDWLQHYKTHSLHLIENFGYPTLTPNTFLIIYNGQVHLKLESFNWSNNKAVTSCNRSQIQRETYVCRTHHPWGQKYSFNHVMRLYDVCLHLFCLPTLEYNNVVHM